MPPRVTPTHHIDLDSTYYIHLSEGPKTINITPKLVEVNYLAWSKSMTRALGAKNKLKFIDGTIQIPTFDYLNFF